MGGVQHFVFTRFNLRASPAAPTDTAISTAWLKRRFELFERFCLPTMRAQQLQDFTWLVLFDTETPTWARTIIDQYASWECFVPVFLPPGFDHGARRLMQRFLKDGTRTLVTTRLDSDDGLASDYVSSVRVVEHTREPLVLQYPTGFVWHGGRLYLDRQERNAFCTLIEPVRAKSEVSTILRGSHSEVDRLGRLLNISAEPGWLQVIHGGNIENHVRGRRCRREMLGTRFAIDVPARSENAGAIMLDRATMLARWGAIWGARKVCRKLGFQAANWTRQ
jgi:hypothetical protein